MFRFISTFLELLLFVMNIYHSDAVDTELGSNTVLTCPFLPGAWHKILPTGFRQLTNDGKYENADTSHLTIKNVEISDRGEYVCNALREHSVIYLNVNVMPPTVNTLNQTYRASIGGTVTLDCRVIGYASDVWWTDGQGVKLNGTRYHVGNLSNSSLTIHDVNEHDSGRYTCVATNSAGTKNQSTQLETGYKPLVKSLDQNMYATFGSQVIIHCSFDSDPEATSVFWKKDGKNISLDDGAKYKGSTVKTPSLTICNVNNRDSGIFVCHVENSFGSSSGKSIKLSVKVEAVQGNNATLTCPFRPGAWNREISNRWRMLTNDDKYVNVNTSQLTIKNVEMADIGRYVCNAPHEHSVIYLNVTVIPPTVNILYQTYLASIGETVTLDCRVVGYASAFWWTDGQGIKLNGTRYHFGNLSIPLLTIQNVNENDSGWYTCVATNAAGTVNQSTQLETGYKPLVKLLDQNAHATVGGQAIIQCSFDSYPEARTVFWKKDDKIINLEEGAKYNGSTVKTPSLTIYNVNNIDSGIYVCHVENTFGSSSGQSVKLSVTEPLKFDNIVEPVSGGISCGIAAIIAVVLLIYIQRKRKASTQSHNYEERENTRVELRYYNEIERPNPEDRNSPLYVNTSNDLISSQNDEDTTSTMCDFRDFLHLLQDKSSLSRRIGKEYQVLNSKPSVRASNDYEDVDIKSGEAAVDDYMSKALVKVLNSKPSVRTSNDYENVDNKSGAAAVEGYINKALVKVQNTKQSVRASNDYEDVDIKSGAAAVEEYIDEVLKQDDKSGFIITAVPDRSDIDNFWTMINNYHVGCVILLLQETEKISEFYPNTIKPLKTHEFQLEICSHQKFLNNISEIVVDIRNKKNKTVLPVTLYKTTGWKVGVKHPSIGIISDLLNVISSQEPGMVVLMGSNGIGFPFCGGLGVCIEVLHAINNKEEFSILETAVELKHIRPDLFQTFDEYNLCYQVIGHFLQKIDN